MDNLPERWKPTLLQVHSHPYSVVYAMALEIGAAEARIAELKEEAETIKQLEAATLPCGHTYRNAVIVDGGKRSYCIVCEQAYTIERLTGCCENYERQVCSLRAALNSPQPQPCEFTSESMLQPKEKP
jgi:hypothetical protein